MAGRVYSTLFVRRWVHDAASATAASYTVPANRLAVVRSIDWYLIAPSTGQFGWSGASYWHSAVSGGTAGSCQTWRGDQVYNAGDVMGVAWTSGQFFIFVSGFLLSTLP